MQAFLNLKFSLPFLLCGALFVEGFHNNRPFANLSSSASRNEALWVDSVFSAMTDAERFGQLFVVRGHLDMDSTYEQMTENLIRQYKPGGICFFNPTGTGTPEKQVALTNRYQAASPQLPLMVSMDLEWGLGMRLRNSTISFPKQIMLGAVEDNRLLYEMGVEVARQCRRLGVHVNFAPDADINNNPANPVINERSFGEDRYNVTAKAYQYMAGLQDGGVLACAKHFPGHGDTDVDSHQDLPVIRQSIERLDSLELYPFRMLAQNGVGSFMVAHLSVPALDPRANHPTSLSRPVITDLLRKKMGFQGLIFTDAMEMKGVTKHFGPGQADVEVFRAGNDVDLLPENLGAALSALQMAVDSGAIDKNQLYESCKRVLRSKYRLGITTPQRVELANIRRDLNTPQALVLKRKLIAASLTLVRDEPGIVGFANLEKYRFASLALGDTNRTVYQTYCGYYAPVRHFNAGKEVDTLTQMRLLDSLKQYNMVLVSIHSTRARASDNFGVTASQMDLLRRLNAQNTVALTMFGNPYSMRFFDDFPIVLDAYTEDPMVQETAAMAMFGASDLKGILPVTASPVAKFGQGVRKIYPNKRLGYNLPESVGMRSDTLALLDTIVQQMIATGAAPGCQILVVKNNTVVWNKGYGSYTYEPSPAVNTETMYDLASVTKVAASTISLMQLTEHGHISLDAPMSDFIPELKKSNKKDLVVREILAHHAGLQAWIPFYLQTLGADKKPSPLVYRGQPEKGYEIPVSAHLYMQNAWADSIWQQIFNSPLRPDKGYKYSDLGLYLGARAIRNTSGQPVDVYADEHFYRPLGLSTTTYRPWKKGLTLRCAPTEDDHYFRNEVLQGYVHDMGAAMLGGVSGHAGLFSSATDLAKIFQMLLNGGSYGGFEFLKPETVRLFTTRFAASTRRGIGFDMKELNPKEPANMSLLAGPNTFGHLGFTGNAVWADPDQNLIFIFLSNRTYPTMDNNKLGDGDFRPRLQSVVYRSIEKPARADAKGK
ncbi:MAG: serine hydrolase [Bacteroidetes bacterium]|nr:serine hydrolase [Bacteroidota bacterium]